MLQKVFQIHHMAGLAIIGSLFGAALMFLIGATEVVEAFLLFFRLVPSSIPGNEITEATATILASLDSFLLGFILLYFAYSLFFLVTFAEKRERFGAIKMPPALKIESLGEMKKTILVVIIVSLSVFLMREIMLSINEFDWTDLFIPFSIVAIAIAIKLIDFEH